jgi:hypothetical protein
MPLRPFFWDVVDKLLELRRGRVRRFRGLDMRELRCRLLPSDYRVVSLLGMPGRHAPVPRWGHVLHGVQRGPLVLKDRGDHRRGLHAVPRGLKKKKEPLGRTIRLALHDFFNILIFFGKVVRRWCVDGAC